MDPLTDDLPVCANEAVASNDKTKAAAKSNEILFMGIPPVSSSLVNFRIQAASDKRRRLRPELEASIR